MTGMTYALVTVVLVRSNSRISGRISHERVSATPGARSFTRAPTACSWAGSA